MKTQADVIQLLQTYIQLPIGYTFWFEEVVYSSSKIEASLYFGDVDSNQIAWFDFAASNKKMGEISIPLPSFPSPNYGINTSFAALYDNIYNFFQNALNFGLFNPFVKDKITEQASLFVVPVVDTVILHTAAEALAAYEAGVIARQQPTEIIMLPTQKQATETDYNPNQGTGQDIPSTGLITDGESLTLAHPIGKNSVDLIQPIDGEYDILSPVTFIWTSLSTGGYFTIVIGRESSFSGGTIQKQTSATHIDVVLEDGLWYWKVKNTAENVESDTWQCNVVSGKASVGAVATPAEAYTALQTGVTERAAAAAGATTTTTVETTTAGISNPIILIALVLVAVGFFVFGKPKAGA